MPARKRAADDGAVTAAETGGSRRRSGRISSTPKQKSSYWEGSDGEDSGSDGEKPVVKKARTANGSGRRVSAAKKKKQESDEDEYTAEAQLAAEAEEEEDDDEEADKDDESRPMKVTVVPLEQMRGEDGVPYEDHKVHKNTMLFLKDLKANNRRPWLKCEWHRHPDFFFASKRRINHSQHTMASTDAPSKTGRPLSTRRRRPSPPPTPPSLSCPPRTSSSASTGTRASARIPRLTSRTSPRRGRGRAARAPTRATTCTASPAGTRSSAGGCGTPRPGTCTRCAAASTGTRRGGARCWRMRGFGRCFFRR